MKLKLPLGLLAALLACLNAVTYAGVTNPADGGTTNTGSNYYISQDVEWTTSHNYYGNGASTVISVGTMYGQGSLTVAGSGTTVNIGNGLFIGGTGYNNPKENPANPGHVQVNAGATLEVGQHPKLTSGTGSQLNVGWGAGVLGSMTVDGEGAKAVSNWALNVGLSANSKGLLTVDNGGQMLLRVGETINSTLSQLTVGYYHGSEGKIVVDHASSLIATGKESKPEDTQSVAYIGLYGKGSIEAKNASTVDLMANGQGMTLLGYYAGGEGAISLDGSTLHSGSLYVGYAGKGSLTSANGSNVDIDGNLVIGNADGATGAVSFSQDSRVDISGYIILGNGSMDMGAQELANTVYATGAAKLDGASAYEGMLVLDGGTVTGSDINLSQNAQLYSGSIANNITGAAGIVKLGSDTVELTGVNTYKGGTTVEGGILKSANAVTGNLTLASGTTLDTPAYTLGAGEKMTLNTTGTVTGTLTLGGGEMVFATMNPLRQAAATNKVGTLDATSTGTTVVNVGDPDILTHGTYTLMSWTDGKGVELSDFSLQGVANAAGSRAAVELLLINNALVLSVSQGEAATLVWDAAVTDGTWKVGDAGSDWTTSAANKNFYDSDSVIFDGNWEGNEVVTIDGKVKPSGIIVSGSGSTQLTGTGSIEGVTSLDKSGSGTLTIDTANNYSGGTTLNGGAIVTGNASALGSGDVALNNGTLNMGGQTLANDVTVNGNGAILGAGNYEGELTVAGGSLKGDAINLAKDLQLQAGSVANSLTGSGAVVKTTAGEATLSGANSYGGGTRIEEGKITLGHEAALGTGDVALNGGALNMGDKAVANNVSVNGDATVDGASAYKGQLTLTDGSLSGGALNLAQDAKLISGSVANDLTGTAGVVKTGTGTVTLSGTNAYTGETMVQGGTLITSSTLRGDVAVAGGAVLQTPELQLGNGQDLALASGATVQGNVSAASGSTLTLAGGSAVNGTLSLNGGTMTLDPMGGVLNIGTLDVAGASTLILTNLTSFGAGTYDILSYSGFSGNLDALTLVKPTDAATRYSYELVQGDKALTLTVSGNAMDLTWNPAETTWGVNPNGDEWFVTGTTTGETNHFCQGDRVTFDKGGTVDLVAEVSPGSIKVTGDADTTISGSGSIAGGASLTKDGTGTLIINTANTYTGGTTLQGDLHELGSNFAAEVSTIEMGNAKALGTGGVTLAGGILDMNGHAVENTVTVTGEAVIKDSDNYLGQLVIDGGTLTCEHVIGNTPNHDSHIHVNLAQDVLFNGGHIEESYLLMGVGGVVVNAADAEGGKAILDGKHTYTGHTLVQTGTLVLDGSVTGTSILVSKGATLDLNVGKFSNGSLVVEDGGTLIGGTNDLELSGSDTLQLGTGTPEGEEAAKTELKGDLTASADSNLVLGGGSNVELSKDDDGDATLTLTQGASVTLDKGATLTITGGATVVVNTDAGTGGGLKIEAGATIIIEDTNAGSSGMLDLSSAGASVSVTADHDKLDQAQDKDFEVVIVGSTSGNSSVIAGDSIESKVELDEVTKNEYRSTLVADDKKISVIVGREDLKWNSETNDSANHGTWKAGVVNDGVEEVKHWNHVELGAGGDITDLEVRDNFFHRDSTVFMDNTADGAEQKITLEGTVKPSSIKVVQDTDLLLGDEASQGSIGGASSIQKDGAGTLTLGTANSFSGGMQVHSGAVVLGAQGAQGLGIIELLGAIIEEAVETTKAILDAGRYAVENEVVISGGTELRNAEGLTNITLRKGSVTDVDKHFVLRKGMKMTVDGRDHGHGRTNPSAARDVQTAAITSEIKQSVTFDGLTLNLDNEGRIGFAGKNVIAGDAGDNASTLNLENWGKEITRRDEIGLIHFTDYTTLVLAGEKGLVGEENVDTNMTVNLANDVLEQYAHLRVNEEGWVVLYFTAPDVDPEIARQLSHNENNAYTTLVAIAKDNEAASATDPLALVAAQAATAGSVAELQKILDDVSGSEYATMMSSQIEGNLAHLRRLRGHMGNGTSLAGSKSGLAAYADAFSEVADVDADSRGQGYRRTEWGAEVGIEQELAEASHIGLALSMGRASISPSSGARYHEDSQMLDAYYVGQFGNWMNRTSIGVGFHQHDLERRMSNGVATSADSVSGTSFNFMEEISYIIPVCEAATLRPFFVIESSVNNIDGFAETGADTLSLVGDSQDAWATDLTLGVAYEQSFAAFSNAPRASFSCHAGVTTSIGDTTSDLSLHFAGAPQHVYSQSSADRDRWGLNLGAGVSVPVTRFTTIYATAETVLRGDATSFDAQLGVRWNF